MLGKSASQEKNHSKHEDRDCRKNTYQDNRKFKSFGHYAEGVRGREQSKTDDYRKNKDGSPLCHFCGEEGHVATIGPGYKQIIQYFACKRFVGMNPDERFRELQKKGFCFQCCLLPGASSNDGKHKEGKCQRDFVCKHTLHHRYPRKKHVLVCHEHRHNKEKEELLRDYKRAWK